MIPKTDIVIVGSSGHAQVVMDIIECQGKYNIIGWIDSFRKKGESTHNYEVLGDENFFTSNANKNLGCLIAIGDNWNRMKMAERIRSLNPTIFFGTAIHPTAVISKNVTIGEGSVIMPNSCININTRIGSHCIINTNSTIEHDNEIGNFGSIAPNCSTGGNVKIGDCSALGIQTAVKHKTVIGAHSIIGASSYVNKDIPERVMAYGVPCRIIKHIEKGHKYL